MAQHERGIPLGPYYLVWDNREVPELLRQGTYGWPYQVTRVELGSKADYRELEPPLFRPELQPGFASFKEFCLTCHRVGSVGGAKYPVDLRIALCRWQADDLKSWIDDPRRFRPQTAMPGINAALPAEERRRVIDQLVPYLQGLATAWPGCAGQDGSR